MGILAAVVALLGAVWLLWGRDQAAFARAATAYGAKKVCSCLYVGGRPMALCEADFTQDVSLVEFADTGNGVEASVLGGLVRETAIHHPGTGCRLEP